MEFDEVKDSGTRQQWITGSQRDSQEGKGLHELIPKYPVDRLAKHYENGAKKYGLSNWKKGQNLRQYIRSGLHHQLALAEGMQDEDHAAAIAWNAFAFMWTANEIEEGRLPAVLDDLHDSGGWTSKYDASLFDDKGFPLPLPFEGLPKESSILMSVSRAGTA